MYIQIIRHTYCLTLLSGIELKKYLRDSLYLRMIMIINTWVIETSNTSNMHFLIVDKIFNLIKSKIFKERDKTSENIYQKIIKSEFFFQTLYVFSI